MGIKKLAPLIKEKCPEGVTRRCLDYYSSNVIAIDASIALYQFLVSIRSSGFSLGHGDNSTSHLIGIFYRTIRLVEAGIVPVYVFDGICPEQKLKELERRAEVREKSEEKLEKALANDDQEAIEKYMKRGVKVEKVHNDESKHLLTLMGIPWVVADSEAEAYGAYLAKSGSVYGIATEDMDALCFGASILIRNINASAKREIEIEEYNLTTILQQLDLSYESFIDMCILMGCDYCPTIKGIGFKKSYELIKKYHSIEGIIENEKYEKSLLENFDYLKAREIFFTLGDLGKKATFSIQFDKISLEKIKLYLCDEKGFDETRVTNGVNRLLAAKSKGKQLKLKGFLRKENK